MKKISETSKPCAKIRIELKKSEAFEKSGSDRSENIVKLKKPLESKIEPAKIRRQKASCYKA